VAADRFFSRIASEQRGASILEILLVMAIVALLSPFMYNQITRASNEITDIATAKQIMKTREAALNFVRLNQDQWPDYVQIKLAQEELDAINDSAHAGFIDKYIVKDAAVTDIYFAFKIGGSLLRSAQIARIIGADAASVDSDGVARNISWAASAPDFAPGDLVYRISHDFRLDNNYKYLRRVTSPEDDSNLMQRNLNMGKFDSYGVGTASAETGKFEEMSAAFIESDELTATSAYFSGGATMDGNVVKIESMRVSGDITGFRNINAKKINREGFSLTGSIIADRVRINNSVNVGGNLNLKSDTIRTISGFAGIVAHSLAISFLTADELTFANKFGLTVSGELLMSSTAPLRIGSWSFPSITPPSFASFEMARAKIPDTPNAYEFDKIMKSGWRTDNN
jgi:type II secretory pathway pseudopilin PulG